MKNLFILLSFMMAFSAFAYDSRFLEGDLVHISTTQDIFIPANVIEVRTSCGVLLEVSPVVRNRVFKAGKKISFSVTSATRFWTRLENTDRRSMIEKVFLNANSFNTTKDVFSGCSELNLDSIEAVDKGNRSL